jgi:hypothetical protein
MTSELTKQLLPPQSSGQDIITVFRNFHLGCTSCLQPPYMLVGDQACMHGCAADSCVDGIKVLCLVTTPARSAKCRSCLLSLGCYVGCREYYDDPAHASELQGVDKEKYVAGMCTC